MLIIEIGSTIVLMVVEAQGDCYFILNCHVIFFRGLIINGLLYILGMERMMVILSMYGILTYIWLIFMVNVGEHTIHGSYGYYSSWKVDG